MWIRALLLRGSGCWGLVPGKVRGLSSGRREVQTAHLEGSNAGIAEIVMCRPHARNALGRLFVNEFFQTIETLRHDSSVRVVVVRSIVPGVFCAGADLKERAKLDNEEVSLFVQGLRNLMSEIAALPMPTIAALDGHALGGGLELALACDLRVAASSAKLGLIETTRGLLPGAGGSQRLPRLLGIGLAKELIFTGRQIEAEQAEHIGLVNHAVPQNADGDAAYKRALELAQEILPQAPVAVRMAKLAISRGYEVDISSGMAIEGMCYGQLCTLCCEGLVRNTHTREALYQ
ncbi:enoyl-CoA hydratase domain-containing protein 2, mitochondrial isoform X2 [Bombina bombina]|uniref:enoyl-CoA hydratase domain-containing protein 2, mitochondrial isoform X2 n=1 Tax=Bombina bombina TaxID=8345 RepID=UPI00235A541E|nr:enoyl-CoA hydratase domain-containing protein 2, mitochondrial isoform X2 [Bombina bombina]